MRHAAIVLALATSLLAPAGSFAADEAARCRSAFVHHGTGVFDRISDVSTRCYVDTLSRVPNPAAEGCPDTAQLADIDTLELRAVGKIDAACVPPLGASGLCMLFAAEEAFDAVDGAFGSTTAFVADGAARRCRVALGSFSVQLAKAKARVLRRCNENAFRGLPGYGPPGAACESPSGTQAAVADAEARVRARIAGKCGTLDPHADLGLGTACTGRPYCESAIATLSDAIDCVACVANAEVDQLSRGLAAVPLDAPASCDVGRAYYVLDLLDRDLRDLSACEEKILDGNAIAPCPDAETSADLAVNGDRYATRLAALCPSSTYPTPDAVRALAASFVDALYPSHAEEPDNTVKRCRSEIGRSATQSSGNARRHLRALRSCHAERLCGQALSACPNTETIASLVRASQGAESGITTRCSAFAPSTLGFAASCPAIGSCGAQPTTTIPDLIACLQCLTESLASDALADALP